MNIKTISKDENNFDVEVTDIYLSVKQYHNFISRIKGELSRIYGRKSNIFMFYDSPFNTTFKIKIPINYYEDFAKLRKVIKDVYDSMRGQR